MVYDAFLNDDDDVFQRLVRHILNNIATETDLVGWCLHWIYSLNTESKKDFVIVFLTLWKQKIRIVKIHSDIDWMNRYITDIFNKNTVVEIIRTFGFSLCYYVLCKNLCPSYLCFVVEVVWRFRAWLPQALLKVIFAFCPQYLFKRYYSWYSSVCWCEWLVANEFMCF